MTPPRLQACAVALLAAALLGACSSVPIQQREAAAIARFQSYSGKPVDQFTWLGHYYSWQYLGQDPPDKPGGLGTYEIAIWTTPWDAYVLKVGNPCVDLPFALGIELTSTARTVSSHFDFVLVRNRDEGRRALPWRCPIQEIRPVDYRRMRQDMRAAPQGTLAPAQAEGSGS
jgi:hypothetical protein